MGMACPSLKDLQRYHHRRDSPATWLWVLARAPPGPVATSLLMQTADLKDLQFTWCTGYGTGEGRSLFAPRLLDRGSGNRQCVPHRLGGYDSSTSGGRKAGLESDSLDRGVWHERGNHNYERPIDEADSQRNRSPAALEELEAIRLQELAD